MILFHDSGYRCLKHFYLEKVCKHMCHLFPQVVSYTRFVELEREVAILSWLCSSRRSFWVNARVSALLTVHHSAYAEIKEYTFIRFSKA